MYDMASPRQYSDMNHMILFARCPFSQNHAAISDYEAHLTSGPRESVQTFRELRLAFDVRIRIGFGHGELKFCI